MANKEEKEVFESPEMELIRFDTEDVIKDSNDLPEPDDSSFDWGDW